MSLAKSMGAKTKTSQVKTIRPVPQGSQASLWTLFAAGFSLTRLCPVGRQRGNYPETASRKRKAGPRYPERIFTPASFSLVSMS
jgi:hypothetical protein